MRTSGNPVVKCDWMKLEGSRGGAVRSAPCAPSALTQRTARRSGTSMKTGTHLPPHTDREEEEEEEEEEDVARGREMAAENKPEGRDGGTEGARDILRFIAKS
ncbi:uncharacterized [Tachysurus ichikawai]